MFKSRIEELFYKFIAKPNVQQVMQILDSVPTVQVDTQKQNIELINGTSTILKIKSKSSCFYFRECRKHLEIRSYVNCFIFDFFKYSNKNYVAFLPALLRQLNEKRTFDSFIKMGTPFEKDSPINQYLKTGKCTFLNFEYHHLDQNYEAFLFDFLTYSWSNLYTYRLNSGLKYDHFEIYSAVRQLATQQIAEIIGLATLIPKTKFAFLIIDDKVSKFGTIMSQAEGIPLNRLKSNKIVSPQLQRELNNLNTLDVLCHEKDHRPANYFIRTNKGIPIGVCAFDNDSPMSFNSPNVFFFTYMRCSPFINIRKGIINRPYMDKEVAQAILSIDYFSIFKKILGLNAIQKLMLLLRIYLVKLAIKKSLLNKTNFLLSKNDWNSLTIEEELCGKFGKTYLQLFIEEYKNLSNEYPDQDERKSKN